MPALTLDTDHGSRHIEFFPGQSLRDVLDSTPFRVRSGCRGTGACGLCRVEVKAKEIDEPTLAERLYLSGDEIASGVRLACQVRPTPGMEVAILNPTPLSVWKTTAPTARCTTHFESPPSCLSKSLPKGIECPYGVAIDLGTTHISLSVYDLSTGKRLTGRHGLNPQAEYGSDVMTRLTAACESPEHAQAMRSRVVDAIRDAILDVATREVIGTEQVTRVVLAGNTAMLALLSGRSYHLLTQPAQWTSCIDCLPDNPGALSRDWGIHPEAHIDVLAPLAGFVGSDLLAGAVATKLVEAVPGSLLIDFGTNSEIALWDGDTLWVTSAAGGPAFEGCGIGCGMPAEPGAVYQVDHHGETGREWDPSAVSANAGASAGTFGAAALHRLTGLNLELKTIGGESPAGLCGSGIVDLMAWLARSGKLTRTGRFAPELARDALPLLDGGRTLALTKKDVDVFQRAKGAISAAIRVLLSRACMGCNDLRRIYVAGAFGHFLNRANAVSIGLLPDVSPEIIQLWGNTALVGCESILMSAESGALMEKTRARARIINLSQSGDFEDFFLDGLYLTRWSDGGL